jgi:hypothetical protein
MITARARAYLAVPGEGVYLDRAHQACDYLLTQQQTDGRFESTSTVSSGATIDDAFDTAEVGWLLVDGYRRFGIPAYLEAAVRAARWQGTGKVIAQYCDPEYYTLHPDDPPMRQLMAFYNANFVGSILRHLANVYVLAGEAWPGLLSLIQEAAQSLATWQILEPNQVSGTWYHYGDYPGGVNAGVKTKNMVYHDLAASGLLAVLEHCPALPSPLRRQIETACWRAMFYSIVQQQSNGLVQLRPDVSQTVACGGWTVADGLRVLARHPTNQERGASFLFALGKGMDGMTTWLGKTTAEMQARMLLLRQIAAIARWQHWWERG